MRPHPSLAEGLPFFAVSLIAGILPNALRDTVLLGGETLATLVMGLLLLPRHPSPTAA